jgi:ferredoxin
MAHVISDECVSCGACEAECPVGAISQGADHSRSMLTLVLTVALALLSVLQEQSLRASQICE